GGGQATTVAPAAAGARGWGSGPEPTRPAWRAAARRLRGMRWLRSTPPPWAGEGCPGAGAGAGTALDLADQVQRRSDGLGAFLPLGRADLARVGGDELGSLQLAQGLGNVAGDGVVMDLHGLDHAFRVDDEGAAQGQALFLDVHAEGAGQLVGRVADQRELGLAHSREIGRAHV